ncbi:MAG: 2-phospho-L-lactate guanylyltransferase [Emcibacter sp.]|nr:2-phospho-L-lactate guanylyltransferase [Emcibacter sp.]
MSMNISILIPVRPLTEGKGRLSPVLTPHERQNLNRYFFTHTLDIISQAVSPARCFVVSSSPEILKLAKDRGMTPITEPKDGDLNRALEQAAQAARKSGANALLSISCDLPYLLSDDISALLAAAKKSHMVIAPDKNRTGTNALLLSPAGAIRYRYGENSYAHHMAAAKRAGLTALPLLRDGLAQDIDTPQDLSEWPCQNYL